MSFTNIKYDSCATDCAISTRPFASMVDINRHENINNIKNVNCNKNKNTNITNNNIDIARKINIESHLFGISYPLNRCSNNTLLNCSKEICDNKIHVPTLCNLSMVNYGSNANLSCNN